MKIFVANNFEETIKNSPTQVGNRKPRQNSIELAHSFNIAFTRGTWTIRRKTITALMCTVATFAQTNEIKFNRLYEKKNSPFNASISFCTAVKVLEFTFDCIFLTNDFLRKLHVTGVLCIRKLSRFTVITVSLNCIH